MKNFYILTLIFLFLTPATAALSLTEQPMAKQRQSQFHTQDKPNTQPSDKTNKAFRVDNISLGKAGFLSLVLQGDSVISAQFLSPTEIDAETKEKAQSQPKTQSLSTNKIVYDDETIIIVRISFSNGSTSFVIIHKATGTTTIVAQ